MASDENTDNSLRNCQYKVQFKQKVGKFGSYENKRQDTELQSQHNADNAAESSIATNPMVMGNNSNETASPK